ncbi:MAG: heparinase II/III family protein [Caldisericia bacterium]|nr:heparinase II/III family protein [Caldisericia bacterium]
MKRNVLLFVIIVGLIGSLFQNTRISFSHSDNFSIPLSPGDWKSYGRNSSLLWKQKVLLWKPGQKNASMVTKLVPTNWSSFQKLVIEYSSNQATGNWITLIVRDQSNHMKFTYFTIDSTQNATVSFSLHELFAAFGGDRVFYWNQIESLAICSHPSADQNIDTLEIQWHQISLSTEPPASDDPFLFQLTEPIQSDKGILFLKRDFPILQEKFHTDTRLQNILSYAKSSPSPSVSTEHLRNLVFQYVFQKQGNRDDILHYANEIQPRYWDQIQAQNDIFVQEHAIHYLISMELLQTITDLPDPLQQVFQLNLQTLCDLEYETCQKWIHHYPYGKGNNHVTRAASLLGLCSLYLEPSEKQNQFLQFSLQILHHYFQFQISDDGVLNEGTHYYTYLLEIFTYFAYGLKNTIGLNLFQDFPFSKRLQSMVEWAISIQKPDGYLPSIDDSWQTRVIFPFRYLIPFFPTEAGFFLWASTCYQNQEPFENEPWNIVKSLYIPFSLLSAIDSDNTVPVQPSRKSVFFPHDSDILFRSMDQDIETYLLFLGKKNSSLHEQNDTGQILIHKGELPLLLESGYGPFGWTSTHRTYYVSHEAHNVPIVDGIGSESWYNGGVGPIDTSFIQDYFYSDLFSFSSMAIQMQIHHPDVVSTRNVFFVPSFSCSHNSISKRIPTYTFMVDMFQSKNIHTYSSIFHPNGSLYNQNETGIHHALPSKQPQNLHVETVKTTDIHEKMGWYSAYWEHEIQKPYYLFSKKGTSVCIESLLSVSEASVSPFSIQRNSSKIGIEYSILPTSQDTRPWTQDVFMINDKKSMAKGDVISTNGTFCFSRMEEDTPFPTSYFVTNASYLNIHQNALFYATSKIDQILHYVTYSPAKKKTWNFEIHVKQEKMVLHFYVPPLETIQRVMLDKEELLFQQNNNKISVTLQSGKHFLTFE